ncbi:hypothetical protein OEZ86_002896 [Tetradesmus obliquus]|nr:hypothetical protein OEZ86_002896 [Tetradesmus obliquus]
MDSRGSSRPESRASQYSSVSASVKHQSTEQLLSYIAKSNNTIKLLQEELHNTSQFAIQLSRKYEAKRAERDQVIKQLQGQQRHTEKQLAQLQVLADHMVQHCSRRDMPAAVAAIVSEFATPAAVAAARWRQQQVWHASPPSACADQVLCWPGPGAA